MTSGHANPTPSVRTAWRSPTAWAALLVTVVLGLAADLWSKHAAFARIADTPVVIDRADVMETERLSTLIPPHDPVVAIPDLLHFTLVLNPGAVFGIGAGKRWIFVGFTLVAIAFAGWMFARWTGPRDRWTHLALGLLVSGGLGNLYDRVLYACVRDFIHPLPGWQLPFGISWPNGSREVWPYVSNVADAFLIVAIAILLLISLKKPAPQRAAASVDAKPDAEANLES